MNPFFESPETAAMGNLWLVEPLHGAMFVISFLKTLIQLDASFYGTAQHGRYAWSGNLLEHLGLASELLQVSAVRLRNRRLTGQQHRNSSRTGAAMMPCTPAQRLHHRLRTPLHPSARAAESRLWAPQTFFPDRALGPPDGSFQDPRSMERSQHPNNFSKLL